MPPREERNFRSTSEALNHYGETVKLLEKQKEYLYECRRCAYHGQHSPFRGRRNELQNHLDVCPYNNRVILVYESGSNENAVKRRKTEANKSDAVTSFEPPSRKRIEGVSTTATKFVMGTGLPYEILDNENFKEFMFELIPELRADYFIPSAKKARDLSERIREDIRQEIIAHLKPEKLHVTLTFDTRTNVNNKVVLGVVYHLPDGTPLPFDTVDVTSDEKNKQACKEQILKYMQVECVKNKLKAVVTDSAAAYKSAKSELARQYPGILFLPCFANQFDLMIKDFAKHVPGVKSIIDTVRSAINIIKASPHREDEFKWLCIIDEVGPTKLVKMAPIRWNTVSRMLKSFAPKLESVRSLLTNLYLNEQDSEKKKHLSDIYDRLGETDLTTRLAKLWNLFDRCATILNYMQRDSTRLRDVLPKFYELVCVAKEELSQEDFEVLKTKWNKRIKSTWDVPVLLVAMVLDPEANLDILANGVFPSSFFSCLTLLDKAIQGDDQQDTIINSFDTFYNSKDKYLIISKLFYRCLRGSNDNPNARANFWKYNLNTDHQRLAELALHLENVVVNSAATKRLFSRSGRLHTEGRSHLSQPKLTSMVQLEALNRIKKRKAAQDRIEEKMAAQLRRLASNANQVTEHIDLVRNVCDAEIVTSCEISDTETLETGDDITVQNDESDTDISDALNDLADLDDKELDWYIIEDEFKTSLWNLDELFKLP